jgi:hypothetical protein
MLDYAQAAKARWRYSWSTEIYAKVSAIGDKRKSEEAARTASC